MNDLLQALRAAVVRDGGDDKPGIPIDPLAQAMELRDRYARCMAPSKLKPGDLARERRGVGTFNDNPVLLVWRLLDWSDPNDRAIAEDTIGRLKVNRLDCMVARLMPGGAMVIMPGELAMLEPCEVPGMES